MAVKLPLRKKAYLRLLIEAPTRADFTLTWP